MDIEAEYHQYLRDCILWTVRADLRKTFAEFRQLVQGYPQGVAQVTQ